ncbi:MAG: glycosyltransferase [Cyanobacteria bacterium RU_5_0]|nr:glycosyltransferase [Cyanobacteria bacterium RU_5_0]
MSVVVTVAIPTYNAAKTIGECLSSLEAQDFPRAQMQIVVGDNGSTDATVQLIKEHFPNVEVVIAPERGSAYARNAAIEVAQGRYLCSTDADCITDPGWVSTLVRTFENSPESVVCLGGQILPYRVETLVEHYRPAWIQQKTLRERTGRFIYAETPNAAFRRSVFDQVGLFDGKAGHDDSDMGARLSVANLEIQYVPDAIVRHRNPANIRELYQQRFKYGVRSVAMANKHRDYFDALDSQAALRQLALHTTRRVIGNLTYKLADSLLIRGDAYGTQIDPLLDTVAAIGNYLGVHSAVSKLLVSQQLRGEPMDTSSVSSFTSQDGGR